LAVVQGACNVEPRSGAVVQFGRVLSEAKKSAGSQAQYRHLLDIFDLASKIKAIFDRKDWFPT